MGHMKTNPLDCYVLGGGLQMENALGHFLALPVLDQIGIKMRNSANADDVQRVWNLNVVNAARGHFHVIIARRDLYRVARLRFSNCRTKVRF